MKLICLATMALLCYSCQRKTVAVVPFNLQTHTDTRGKQMLLGLHKKEDLQQSPYKEWFDKNYSDYKIDSNAVALLTPLIKNKQF